MWGGINRRKFPRVHYKCIIHIHKKGSEKRISTQTENIGEGGICVIVNEGLGLFQGVNLEINFECKGTPIITCNGTVVWVVKKRDINQKSGLLYDLGIEFVDLKEEDRKCIAQIVENVLSKA